MARLKVDLDKSHRLALKLTEQIAKHLENETMNTAEIVIALNEVAYHVAEATKIDAGTINTTTKPGILYV